MPDPRPSFLVLAAPLARKVLGLWIGCHVFFAFVSLLAASLLGSGDRASPGLWPGPAGSTVLVMAVPLLFLVDLRIQRLNVFLANLGIPLHLVLTLALVQASGLELLAGGVRGMMLGGTPLP